MAIGRNRPKENRRAEAGEYELRDVVEPALAKALLLAAEAQRWDVVMRIAGELEKRREGRERLGSDREPVRGASASEIRLRFREL